MNAPIKFGAPSLVARTLPGSPECQVVTELALAHLVFVRFLFTSFRRYGLVFSTT